jgi:hypothetical protein
MLESPSFPDSFETTHSMDGGWPVDRGKEAQMIHDAKVDVLVGVSRVPPCMAETLTLMLERGGWQPSDQPSR